MAKNFRFGCLFLFSIPFAGVGAMMAFVTFHDLWTWRDSHGWDEVQAKLLKVELASNHSSDSTTYEVLAEYEYDYGGRQFQNTRVGLTGGSDNLGDYQERVYNRLKEAFDRNEMVACYVDPDNPGSSLLDRELRYGVLLFYLVFVLAFGGVGFGLMGYSLYQAYTWLKSSKYQFLVKPKPRPAAAQPSSTKTATSNKTSESEVGQSHYSAEALKPRSGQRSRSSNFMKGRVLETESGKKIMRRALTAIIWNVIGIPLAFMLWPAITDGDLLLSLIMIFPVIGFIFLYGMVLDVMHWRRFGLSHLSFDQNPQAGSTFEAVLSNRTLERFDKGFAACLKARSGKSLCYEESVSLEPDARGGVNLALAFPIPEDLDLSTPLEWELLVTADIPGVDFRAEFKWQTGPTK